MTKMQVKSAILPQVWLSVYNGGAILVRLWFRFCEAAPERKSADNGVHHGRNCAVPFCEAGLVALLYCRLDGGVYVIIITLLIKFIEIFRAAKAEHYHNRDKDERDEHPRERPKATPHIMQAFAIDAIGHVQRDKRKGQRNQKRPDRTAQLFKTKIKKHNQHGKRGHADPKLLAANTASGGEKELKHELAFNGSFA